MIVLLYILTLCILFGSLYLYFPVARKYGLLAGVNNRSSHKKPVITGAGFVFFLSYLCYTLYNVLIGNNLHTFPWWMMGGMTVLAILSFVDDICDLWYLIRLPLQFLALMAMLWQLKCDFAMTIDPAVVQWMAAVMLLFIAVGSVNLYNFMDGINGMLGGMALSMALPILLIDLFVPDAKGFVDPHWIGITILSVLVFLFFNYRNEPKCFSGDVGSIVLGYIMAYLVFSLLIETGNVVYILLFAVVYIEAGLTVVQRLFAGENIFKPHRIHFFQLFCNNYYKSHKMVSACYAGIQLTIGLLLFVLNYFEVSRVLQNLIMWPLFGVLCTVYLVLKRRRMGGHLLEYQDFLKKREEENQKKIMENNLNK